MTCPAQKSTENSVKQEHNAYKEPKYLRADILPGRYTIFVS